MLNDNARRWILPNLNPPLNRFYVALLASVLARRTARVLA